MSFYRDRIFPRIMNKMMNTKETRRIRELVCAPLHGEVAGIGFSTGHNLAFMPPPVTRVLAVEPLDTARMLASAI